MRRRFGVGLVAAAVLGGLVVWPASPAAAAEVTYEDVPCEMRFTNVTANEEETWTISAEGPSEPVAPGETFTLRNLVVTEHKGLGNEAGELTVLGGQVIDLGFSENMFPDNAHQWDVGDVQLTAPTEFGSHGINPEATWHRSPTSGSNFLGYFCPREGESFPDEPFAFVEVADVDPTPTTTTTVPTNGNGDGNGNGVDPNDNGDGDGDGGVNGGVDPDADVDAEAELDAEFEAGLEAEVEALEAGAAQLVGASPRFAG